jgi:hypothetical protein
VRPGEGEHLVRPDFSPAGRSGLRSGRNSRNAEHAVSSQTFGPLTVDTSTGGLTKNQVTYYSTQRTVSVAGTGIYVNKTDGPGIHFCLAAWYDQGNNSTDTWTGQIKDNVA